VKKLGIFIPEFPGQTHAFFIREIKEINNNNIKTKIISTRLPRNISSMATHQWAKEMQKETKYLFPFDSPRFITSIWILLKSGPRSWLKIVSTILRSDLSFKEKIQQSIFVMLGADLVDFSKKNNISHIHVHSCANTANITLYSRFMNGPTYSMTLHGPIKDYGNNQINKWKNAHFGIVITHDLMAELRKKIPKQYLPDLYIAPMGVDVKKFQRTKPYQFPIKNKLIKIVSCGRINRIKGHDDLIRATSVLINKYGMNVQLDICGAADSNSEQTGYYESLVNMTIDLNVQNNVNFLGSISEEILIDILEHAHFFCLASHKEPLGVAIMEALAMEVPTIITRSPGTEELIENNINGILVDPKSPEQFASHIIELIDSPDTLSKMISAGRKTVIDKFHSGLSASIIAEKSRLLKKANNE